MYFKAYRWEGYSHFHDNHVRWLLKAVNRGDLKFAQWLLLGV